MMVMLGVAVLDRNWNLGNALFTQTQGLALRLCEDQFAANLIPWLVGAS
jgi:hypothetical protein